MKFSELYQNSRQEVEKVLSTLWCGKANNESQASYIRQLNGIIAELFAPSNAVPLVQCMNSYQTVHSVPASQAKALIGNLWTMSYPPFEHQYQSWKTLLADRSPEGKPMSICVTTGTGSGKTECFMMPLVKDLLDVTAALQKHNGIQALFLYPLNALMEDQKERLENLLQGTDLTYTVYNGDLPEDEPKANDNSTEASQLRRRIDNLRGKFLDENGQVKYRFPKFLYTRKMVRKNPPDILLTNPTMLEYILLRGKDAALIDKDAKSLRWVVIDETHSYTGAGAAELAMLLRRVLLAFGVSASEVHFATSSATMGNAKDKEQEKENEGKLQDFISGITGVAKEQVRVIGGKRSGEDRIPHNDDESKWRKLCREEYVSLDDLFGGKASITEKLSWLDALCDRVPLDGKGVPLLKAKMHFFFRVPNNGLYVNLGEHSDGSFKILTANAGKLDNGAPLLELCRCRHCGEYVAIAKYNATTMKFSAPSYDDSDMFDLEPETENSTHEEEVILGLSNQTCQVGDNNAAFNLHGDKLEPMLPGDPDAKRWHIVGNLQRSCPYCNCSLTGRREQQEADVENANISEGRRLRKFRLPTDLISRIIASPVLNQLETFTHTNGERPVLHQGQQFLSFADSRQAAAKATLKLNLDQERLWVYSVIYHELNKRKAEAEQCSQQIAALRKRQREQDVTDDELDRISDEIRLLKNRLNPGLSWNEIAELLLKDDYCQVFGLLFVKRTENSEELTKTGEIRPDVLRKYVHSIMVEHLSRRPLEAFSPENIGLFHSYYPQLEDIRTLPEAVENFNKLLAKSIHQISLDDWKNLLQVFLDYTIRSNESVFLKLTDDAKIDISSCVRFAAERPHRRSATRPVTDKFTMSRIVRYLCFLLMRDKQLDSLQEAFEHHQKDISSVVDALWDDLTRNDARLLERSVHWDDEHNCYEYDKGNEELYGPPLRFNLANLHFKLYDHVALCDVGGEARRGAILRPIENHFKGLSPYLSGGEIVELDENLQEDWQFFPYYRESGTQLDDKMLGNWVEANRKLLCACQLWGADGIHTSRLNDIHHFPNLFIQEEHTAQIDKSVARQLQEDFKNHAVNILACSTTMEMGIDLGDLEVVVLNSVPPQPANYKQRVGRSGRNTKVRSACLTLCGSDSIGLRTMLHPLENIVNRQVQIPTVDLMSPQVVQRHVNSFLVRAFGVFSDNAGDASLNQRIVNYYTPYHIERTSTGTGQILEIKDSEAKTKDPSDGLGDETGTMYALFNQRCAEALSEELARELGILLQGTVFERLERQAVDNARTANERCYQELYSKLSDYRIAYKDAAGNEKWKRFRTKLQMQYMEVLNTRLLNYWATNRFTPNANMPVSVLSLDLNSTGKRNFFTPLTSSNPSYSLQEAIGQYAPGNTVVVDGVSYTVRGIEFSNMYQSGSVKTFKTIYRNASRVVIDDKSLDAQIPWTVNNQVGVTLVQPVGFLPDMNEEKNRLMEPNVFTHVSAQLIGAHDWKNEVTEPHLFSVRSNRDSGDANILYYNEGTGYGYCLCTRCGRTVLEHAVASAYNSITDLPNEMNPRISLKDGRRYHYAITGKEQHHPCGGGYSSDGIRRNIIIGDLIQTDFCEIRIRHRQEKKWRSNQKEDKKLLTTLGIALTQALLELLGKERNAVNFVVMPNGHLCLFDTNPGGAGYANQLASVTLMKETVLKAKVILEQSRHSLDVLLDRNTMCHADNVDVEAALSWIQEEIDSCIQQDDAVKRKFPTSLSSNLVDMERAFETSPAEDVLFFGNRYDSWDLLQWQNNFLPYFGRRRGKTAICLLTDEVGTLPEPIRAMLWETNACAKCVNWVHNPFQADGFYPLAYINNTLYFTNDAEKTALNAQWGNGSMHCERTPNNPASNAKPLDLAPLKDTVIFTLGANDNRNIVSRDLGKIIEGHAASVVRQFAAHCKNESAPLNVIYHDAHLKSVFGIIITLQVIEHFVTIFNKSFSVGFEVVNYQERYTARGSITSDLKDGDTRDKKLKSMVEDWTSGLKTLKGELSFIKPEYNYNFSHWRELSFSCGNKKLSIFPDGGFANGWVMDRSYYKKNRLEIPTDTAQVLEVLHLQHEKEIKYDLKIQ